MSVINRKLKILLPKGQSAFLWGPRKTGKTTFLKQNFKNSYFVNLLKSDLFNELQKRPALFRERILALPKEQLELPIIVDEVQKIPSLLDEVHFLIEEYKLSFILCGSSARKLKRGHANMLGGRAWRYQLFAFTFSELENLDLLKSLQTGLIPSHYLEPSPKKSLEAYIINYLKEEIQLEGLVRNLPAFSKFLDVASFCHAELVNYTNVSRECGVASKTVKEYFQILEDTLIGSLLLPFQDKRSRDNIYATPKFYYFDNGVANYLKKITFESLKGTDAGKSFEAFIYNELRSYIAYCDKNVELAFWRTKNDHEIDFIINNGEIAIEVKISSNLSNKDIKPLKVFSKRYPECKNIIVNLENAPRVIDLGENTIDVIPYQIFLKKLWNSEYF